MNTEHLKPPPTLTEVRATYLAAMEHLDATAKRAAAAIQNYNAAQRCASLARQEMHDLERDITNSFHFTV